MIVSVMDELIHLDFGIALAHGRRALQNSGGGFPPSLRLDFSRDSGAWREGLAVQVLVGKAI
jgi:hypothetical protein